jgi:hypothetical protein
MESQAIEIFSLKKFRKAKVRISSERTVLRITGHERRAYKLCPYTVCVNFNGITFFCLILYILNLGVLRKWTAKKTLRFSHAERMIVSGI